MSRNYEIYLEDVLEAINRIQAYMQGITRTEFESDRMRFDAIIQNLEVIKLSNRCLSPFERSIQVLSGEKLPALKMKIEQIIKGLRK